MTKMSGTERLVTERETGPVTTTTQVTNHLLQQSALNKLGPPFGPESDISNTSVPQTVPQPQSLVIEVGAAQGTALFVTPNCLLVPAAIVTAKELRQTGGVKASLSFFVNDQLRHVGFDEFFYGAVDSVYVDSKPLLCFVFCRWDLCKVTTPAKVPAKSGVIEYEVDWEYEPDPDDCCWQFGSDAEDEPFVLAEAHGKDKVGAVLVKPSMLFHVAQLLQVEAAMQTVQSTVKESWSKNVNLQPAATSTIKCKIVRLNDD